MTSLPSPAAIGPRLIFVGGLHRSGTSALTRALSAHSAVSAFRDTGVPEDEGQHLQDVYRPALAHGGPGRFALDPGAHMTELHPLASADSARRLVAGDGSGTCRGHA